MTDTDRHLLTTLVLTLGNHCPIFWIAPFNWFVTLPSVRHSLVCLTYLSFHFYHLHLASKLFIFPSGNSLLISFWESTCPPSTYSYLGQFAFHCYSQACQDFWSAAAFPAEGKVWVSSVPECSSLKLQQWEIKPTLTRLPFQQTLEAPFQGWHLVNTDKVGYVEVGEQEKQISPQHLACKLMSCRLWHFYTFLYIPSWRCRCFLFFSSLPCPTATHTHTCTPCLPAPTKIIQGSLQCLKNKGQGRLFCVTKSILNFSFSRKWQVME